MKINSNTTRALAASPLPRVEPNATSVSGSPNATHLSSAQVALSGASRQLLALQEGGNDIDMERVSAIRAAIAQGQLKIDPSRITDSLIASAKELLK